MSDTHCVIYTVSSKNIVSVLDYLNNNSIKIISKDSLGNLADNQGLSRKFNWYNIQCEIQHISQLNFTIGDTSFYGKLV
jgi:chemotaxis receptor (MCP) glutamine deamidase CheD